MDEMDENQNFTNRKGEIAKDLTSILSQHEDLRRATLIKHRKVSTQLKLDMIQRQLSTLRRTGDSASDRQFYRSQMAELSSELHDLGSTLDKVERNAFYAKKRLMRHCGISLDSDPLSASNPNLWTSAEDLRGSRSSLKARVRHLVSSSPTGKFKKRNFFGELRAAASLSSLNMKSGSPTSDDSNSDPPSSKDTKSWKKSPFRFLGHLVDSRFRRSFWRGKGHTQRTKSADNILDDNKNNKEDKNNKDDGLEVEEDEGNVFSSSSSSESEDEEDWRTVKVVPRYAVRGPVMRKISSHQKAQVDPAVLAEIEDFERMAENYIKQHS